MSLLFFDGFDHLDDHWYGNGESALVLPKWETKSEGNGPNGTYTGRLEGRYLKIGTETSIHQSIPSGSEFIIGVAVKVDNANASHEWLNPIVMLKKGHRVQTYLMINGYGFFEVYRGAPDPDDKVLLGRSINRIPMYTWMFVELKVKLDNTSGSVELRVDGEEEIKLSGINTVGQDDDTANVICLAADKLIGSAYFDDLYVCNTSGSLNNNFLGGVQVSLMLPDGNGASSQWVGSDGNSTDNYLLVDDSVPSEPFSTYVQSYTANDIDSYTYSSLSFSPLNIKGVMVNVLNRRGSVQARKFAPLVRLSSTNYVGTTMSSEKLERVKGYLWETNPNTSAAWTKDNLDGAEFGVKVI